MYAYFISYFLLKKRYVTILSLYRKQITGERGNMLNFIRGFCMALADSVPGVSGGTVAFLLGFYDKFITSLDHLMSGTKKNELKQSNF